MRPSGGPCKGPPDGDGRLGAAEPSRGPQLLFKAG